MDLQISTPVLQAALVDLDATYFIQMALFLVLYIILTIVFFKPYVKFLNRRDDRTSRLRERAKDLLKQAQALEETAERELSKARTAAVLERRRLAEEGARLRDEIVSRERERMQVELDRQLATLDVRKGEFLSRLDEVAAEVASLIEGQIDSAEGKAQ